MENALVAKKPRKILLIKPSSLGDVIHGLPVLHGLKTRYPDAAIQWVVAKGFDGILAGHPLIQKLWIINKDSWKRLRNVAQTLSELRLLSAGLRNEHFDLVIDLQGLFRSAMIGMFSGTAERVGFESAREGAKFTYKYRVKTDPELHAVEKNMRIAQFLGCNCHDPAFPMPALGPVPTIVRNLSRYVVIAPSAGTMVKRWPPENFGKLASMLPIRSVIVGGKADKALGDEIERLSARKSINMAGKTSLKELAAIISGAEFLVSPDTGPMHIAAALRVPVFALFGPTNPARTGPYGDIHTIIRKEMPCSPCYKRKECETWDCMTGISPEIVFKIIGESVRS